MKEIYECGDCGLIYWGEMINVVDGDRSGVVGNYCPNCGSENPGQRADLEPVR